MNDDNDYWRIQAADVLTQLHECEAERDRIVQSADSLINENAALRTEIQHRAEIDAEDTHRLQRYTERVLQENAQLRAQLNDVIHDRELEYARMAALLGACQDMLNQLVLLCREDESTLWRLGGGPFERAYQELRHAVEAVRPQADALLAKMAELIQANNEVAQLNADYLIALDASYRALMSYAHGNSAPALAEEVAAMVLATIEGVQQR